MTRWLLHSLALAVLVCCLCALPALGQSATDLSDDFDDGVLDSSKWLAASWPDGTSGSVAERDGMLVMTRGTEDACGHQVWSLWALRGAFDVQVDYQLLEWPQAPYLGVTLMARTTDSYSGVTRYQNTGWEAYVAGYLGPSQCICGGQSPTSDMSGTLRLVRDADDNLTGYYWSAEGASWIAFDSATVPGDMRISLDSSAAADSPATVAFDNFRVNSGELAPTPDPNDYFDDGVIDTTRWYVDGDSIVEADGKVTITGAGGGLRARWKLRGPFDYQVDYQLLDWPTDRYAALGLLAELPSDTWSNWSAQRVSIDYGEPSWQCYLADYVPPPGDNDFIYGLTPTADTAGTLRLTRDEDSVLTVSVRSAGASDWTVIYSTPMSSDDVRPIVACWSSETPIAVAFDNFQVRAGELVSLVPVIEDVMIDRGRDTDWWDWTRYHQRVTVQVRGSTDEQPACVIIDDPDGSQYVISTCNPVGWYDWVGANPGFSIPQLTIGPDYTYTYTWYEARKPQPLLPGSYQIRVIGNNGSQPTLTTTTAPAVPEEGPVLTGPAADGVVETTVPTFTWLSPPGSESWLQLRAEGETNYTGPVADDEAEIWRAYVGEQATAEYNFDGSGPDLDPGRTYFWQVNSWTPVDDRVSDPLVSIWNEQTARHRFTIDADWPPLPDLLGRLVYTQTGYGHWSRGYDAMAIAQYGPTVGARSWIGPAASEFPDFSWDGSALQYHISDAGTWIGTLDGAAPTRVPDLGLWAFYSSFSPDATSIVYCEPTDPNWVLDVWAQQLDGSDKRLLVPARGRETRYPRWSPDGAWITYVSCCDPSGNNVWLIRPDGTQDHPVVPTTAAGYPGWEVVWLGTASLWSPDATRLLTNFTAISPDGSEFFNALGTISRDGGEVTPVWINPPEYYCCAAAFPNAWSPDGRSVVFASAHHLAPDPEWLDAKFEPGVELWLAPADGSGPPVRLTYDYSYANGSSWWAPNTPVGNQVPVLKGDASATFAQVTAEGSTRMNVTDDVPGPAPEGYAFASDVWSGATTAGYQGDISVALPYDASVDGAERALVLMQWNPARAKWQNITARPIDVANHVIRGRTRSLGVFAVCVKMR
jgi:Tol biopolymer transport system component